MNRRQGIIAAITGVVAMMSNRAKTEPGGTVPIITFREISPQTVTFNLDTFATFNFTLKGETVTITGAEIFEALKHG